MASVQVASHSVEPSGGEHIGNGESFYGVVVEETAEELEKCQVFGKEMLEQMDVAM